MIGQERLYVNSAHDKSEWEEIQTKRITKNEKDIKTNKTNITKNKNNITTLDTRVTAIEHTELPIATTTNTGVVKIGTGLKIDTDGTISVTGGGGGSCEIPFNSATVHYNQSHSSAGTGSDNERQIFIDGKYLPISVLPYDFSTSTWRTCFISNWVYHQPDEEHINGYTQILFIMSETNANVTVTGLLIE